MVIQQSIDIIPLWEEKEDNFDHLARTDSQSF